MFIIAALSQLLLPFLASECFRVWKCLYLCGLPNSAYLDIHLLCLLWEDVTLNSCGFPAARLRGYVTYPACTINTFVV